MVYLCREEDSFLEDKPLWVVDLSNGERIYKDDFRPRVDPPQAWRRLSIYVKNKNLKIVHMHLKFRGHLEHPLPDHAHGYFFSHKASAIAFGEEVGTMHSFLVGHFNGEYIQIQEWVVPALIQIGNERRTINDLVKKDQEECLISAKPLSMVTT